MQYRTLGRTGLDVSILGLGSGGASMLGQRYELPISESTRLVRHALDAGVNFLDTAPGYGESEDLLGQALVGVPRDRYVLCSKFAPITLPNFTHQDPGDVRPSIETSLRRLGTDYLDVFYLHNVNWSEYASDRDRFLPELRAARDAGLIRYIGITEDYGHDHQHEMARRAIADGVWDVLMVGLNVLSPFAITSVLPAARAVEIGIVVMCAVRSVLTDPGLVSAQLRDWQGEGVLAADALDADAGLSWLLDDDTSDVASAAYKFAALDAAVGSVLTGTARVEHFDDNLRAILGRPLPAATYQRVLDLFGPIQRNVQPPRPATG
jgi:L-galactose dehydrogenase